MYPIRFEADYIEERNRVTTFFRLLLAIPHLVVIYVYALVGLCAVFVAWFALLFTGKYPPGLYNFVSGLMHYGTRLNGYCYLLTDEYPPFSGGEYPEYPVRLQIDPPQDEYNRVKVLLRIFYVIPAAILNYALSLLAQIVAFVAWFVIVLTGRQNKSMNDLIRLGVSYQARVAGLFLLLTETYPPISDEGQGEIGAPPAPTLPITAPEGVPGVVQPTETQGPPAG
jgi:uncharacterized protein DUF4389